MNTITLEQVELLYTVTNTQRLEVLRAWSALALQSLRDINAELLRTTRELEALLSQTESLYIKVHNSKYGLPVDLIDCGASAEAVVRSIRSDREERGV